MKRFVAKKLVPEFLKVAEEAYIQGGSDMAAGRHDVDGFVRVSRRNLLRAAESVLK